MRRFASRGPRLAVLALFLALLLIASACGDDDATTTTGLATTTTGPESTTSGGDAPKGGTLTVALTSPVMYVPDTPPGGGNFEPFGTIGFAIYEGLYCVDFHGGETEATFEPCLAESVEANDTFTVFTFKLREDVTFHDGTPFNAEAVDFQFSRTLDPDFEYYSTVAGGSVSWRFPMIESWRTVDEFTFEFTTSEPAPNITSELGFILIPSPAAVMEFGNENYPEHASGTGPFKMTEYDVAGGFMRLERNEDWWGGFKGKLAELDALEFRAIGEPSSRLAALQSGGINMAFLPPPDSVDQLEAEGYQIFLKPYPHQMNVFLDMRHGGPLADVRVRKAISYAIDREGIVAVLNGLASPAGQWVIPGSRWYDDSWEGYTYQPDTALDLLAEAGFTPEELTFTLVSPTGGSGNMWPQPMAEKIQQDLADVGITLNIEYLEPGPAGQLLVPGSGAPQAEGYDMHTWSLAHIGIRDVNHFTTAAGNGAGCCNWGGYSNPEVDALYAEASQLPPGPEQDALIKEYLRIALREDAAFVVTVHDQNFRAASPEVMGFVQPISWFVDFTDVWVDEG